MYNSKIKQEKGITLVALVITIVIIMILSTIAINTVFGENGLIKQAENAKEVAEISSIKESLEMAKMQAYMEGNGTVNPDRFFEILEEQGIIVDKDADVEEIEEGVYQITTEKGYVFEVTITEDGDMNIDHIGKEDNLAPRIKEINVTGRTTNSITVEVDARDAEGGEYTYWIKKQNEGEELWQEKAGNNNTCTFEGLETNVSYSIRVKVVAENGEAQKETVITTGEMPTGTITFTNKQWVGNGTAKITINTSAEGYRLQYQIKNSGDSTLNEGEWKDTTSGSEITGLTHGQTVYGRLYDGTNGTEPASASINDTEKPVVSNITTGEITTNSIQVTVTATDGQSGLAETDTYKFYKNGNYVGASTSNSYTYTDLEMGTEYTLKVEAYDKAGLAGENSIKASTEEKIATNVNELKAGDYVTYPSSQGNLACRVLYDSSSGYGVQLITSDTVKDITMGLSEDISSCITSYNNSVGTLNSEAGKYNNSTYSTRARCVGSHPTSTTDTTTYFTSSESYMSSYNGQLKNEDTNYKTDQNQLVKLRIETLKNRYWMASRQIKPYVNGIHFIIRFKNNRSFN